MSRFSRSDRFVFSPRLFAFKDFDGGCYIYFPDDHVDFDAIKPDPELDLQIEMLLESLL